MAFTLNQNKGDNVVSIKVELPSGGSTTVLLDFLSEYDKQETFRSLDVTQKGGWIVGTLPEDRIPDTGNYRVTVSDSVFDGLALNDIHVGLNEIQTSLEGISGPARSQLLKIIRAVVIGEDFPSPVQPVILDTTIVQPTAVDQSITQPDAVSLKRRTNRS